jgi:hypothetical protein
MKDVVLLQWDSFLDNLSKRERDIGFLQKGEEFVWVQLLKDIMRFFRLVFRLRFHRWDKRNDNNQETLVETIIYELGFKNWDYELDEVFQFFYPTLDKLRKSSKVKEGPKFKSFSLIHDDFSNKNLNIFTSNDFSKQLLAFFVVNFAEIYQQKMEGTFKREVAGVINKIILEILKYVRFHY